MKYLLSLIILLIANTAVACVIPEPTFYKIDPFIEAYYTSGATYLDKDGYRSTKEYLDKRFPGNWSYQKNIVTTSARKFPNYDLFYPITVTAGDKELWPQIEKLELLFVVSNPVNRRVFPYPVVTFTLDTSVVKQIMSQIRLFSPKARLYVLSYHKQADGKTDILVTRARQLTRFQDCGGEQYAPTGQAAIQLNKRECTKQLKDSKTPRDNIPACLQHDRMTAEQPD
ncbi:MAG: hypothetical protein OEZ39_01020 [Gammaproteobacteria bacterium]|nr:hypothetical protein [Gammaproteobacteria bacterium]MDH5650432.1 hypothetical protein [Gammaproteobacteria bacterium]